MDKDNIKEKTSDIFLTPEEVAKLLRIHVLTVYKYIQKDTLCAVRLGRNYRISQEALADFIDSKRTRINV